MKGCQEITELIEKGNITTLSRKDRVTVRVHLMLCKLCREFQKDSRILDKAIQKALRSPANVSFSPVEKEELILRLKGN